MSKSHRGKGIRELFAHGRGDCPVCKRSNVKVLYEQEAGDQKIKICKTCRAAIKNGTKTLPGVTAKPAAAPAPAAAEPAPAAKAAEPVAAEEAAVEKEDAPAAESED